MRGHRIALALAGVALAAWCGFLSGYHRTTFAAELTWILTLAVVLVIGVALRRGKSGRRPGWHLAPVGDPWPRPGNGGGGPALRGVAPWLTLIVVVIAWEILGIDSGPHQYHLTVSALAQAYRPLNAALLLVWVLVGIGYEVARARAPIEGVRVVRDAEDPDVPGAGTALAATTTPFAGHHALPALLLPQSPPVGVAFWVAVPIAAVLIDLTARHSDGRLADAQEFIRFVSTSMVANVALIAAWVFAGYHLFAR